MSTLRTVSFAASRRTPRAIRDTIRVPRTQLHHPSRSSRGPFTEFIVGAFGWTATRLMAGLLRLDEQLTR